MLRTSSFEFRWAFDRTSDAFGNGRPCASTTDPEKVANVCAAAIGIAITSSASTIATRASLVIGWRSMFAFNMAATLLFRLDGGAIAGAGDQVRRPLRSRASP